MQSPNQIVDPSAVVPEEENDRGKIGLTNAPANVAPRCSGWAFLEPRLDSTNAFDRAGPLLCHFSFG